MKLKIFAAVITFVFLCGCNGYSEPNTRYMVTTLGAESIGEQKILHIQAVDISQGEKNGSPATFTVAGKGESFEDALSDAQSYLSKKASMRHLELLVISNDMFGSDIKELVDFCDSMELSLQTRLATCEDIKSLFENEGISAGTQLVALIKSNARTAGFGGHTALYEIETAILTAEGNFALPILSADKTVSVEGLQVYTSLNPVDALGYEESVRYAKENNLYEGEK